MPPLLASVLAVLLSLGGLVLSLFVLVFLLAGGANSTPAWITATKAMMWSLLIPAAITLIGVPFALFTSRPPLGLTLAVLPGLAAVLVFATFWELGQASIDREWSVQWGKAAVRATLVLAATAVALYFFHRAAADLAAASPTGDSAPRRWLTLCLAPFAPVVAHFLARVL